MLVRLAGGRQSAAALLVDHGFDHFKQHACQFAGLMRERLGTRILMIGMSSCIASPFPGDAFISSKPERTITFTSSPPRRREVRQPIHRGVAAAEHDHAATDLSTWPTRRFESQSMPIWIAAAPRAASAART